MDIVGAFFLLLFLLVLTVSNVLFIKNLKKNNITQLKYKLIFFIISIISFVATIFTYYIFNTYILIGLFEIQMINSTYKARFLAIFAIGVLNSVANFLLLRFCLKMIYLKEQRRKNEIELIGTE